MFPAPLPAAYAPLNQAVPHRERPLLGHTANERRLRISAIILGVMLTLRSSTSPSHYSLSMLGAHFLAGGLFALPRGQLNLKKITLIALMIVIVVGEGLLTGRQMEQEQDSNIGVKILVAAALISLQSTVALAGRAIGECLERADNA
jgi:hypothetical protein